MDKFEHAVNETNVYILFRPISDSFSIVSFLRILKLHFQVMWHDRNVLTFLKQVAVWLLARYL